MEFVRIMFGKCMSTATFCSLMEIQEEIHLDFFNFPTEILVLLILVTSFYTKRNFNDMVVWLGIEVANCKVAASYNRYTLMNKYVNKNVLKDYNSDFLSINHYMTPMNDWLFKIKINGM